MKKGGRRGKALAVLLSFALAFAMTAPAAAYADGDGDGGDEPDAFIVYHGNGEMDGSVPNTQSAHSGDDVTVAENSGNLVLNGYYLAGWVTDTEHNTGFINLGGIWHNIPAGENNLYAYWAADYDESVYWNARVEYDANGADSGNIPINSTVKYFQSGSDAQLAENEGALARSGYELTGWNTQPDGSGDHFSLSGFWHGIPAGEHVLYAEWNNNGDGEEPDPSTTPGGGEEPDPGTTPGGGEEPDPSTTPGGGDGTPDSGVTPSGGAPVPGISGGTPDANPSLPAMSKVKINSAKAGKRMLTVKWAKPSPAQKVDGYQVSWRINKKSAKWTTKDVTAPKSSLAIKKLKKGSRYQLRIRPYRIENGSKVYGQWSSAGSKKIK